MRLGLWWRLFAWIFWWRLWFWLKAVGGFGFLIHSDFLVEVVVLVEECWWVWIFDCRAHNLCVIKSVQKPCDITIGRLLFTSFFFPKYFRIPLSHVPLSACFSFHLHSIPSSIKSTDVVIVRLGRRRIDAVIVGLGTITNSFYTASS